MARSNPVAADPAAGPARPHPPGRLLAAATAATAALALAMAVTTPPRSGPFCRAGCVAYPYTDVAAFVPRDYLWMYPALTAALLFAVLTAVLTGRVPAWRAPWARAATALAAIGAGALVVDYGVQLTVLQPALLAGETDGLSPWSQYDPHGLFIALENVGYGVFGLAMLCGGLALAGQPRRTGRLAGRTLAGGGLLVLATLVALAVGYGAGLEYRFEVASLSICWLVMIVAGVLLALAWHRPPRIDGAIVIHRPAGVVFDLVADERNEPGYNPRLRQVELLTPEPVGLGSRFRARAGTGRRATTLEIEFTEFDRPHRLGSATTTAGMAIEGGLTFEPVVGGTRLRWSWTVRPHGVARLLGPVVTWVGRRQERVVWTSLKHHLETVEAPAPPVRAG